MRFSGKRPSSAALERVDVVDAFADERALAEQVLVDVGDGARVRIDARVAAEQRDDTASGCALGQAHAHARLQDAVAVDHARRMLIKRGAVERMGHACRPTRRANRAAAGYRYRA